MSATSTMNRSHIDSAAEDRDDDATTAGLAPVAIVVAAVLFNAAFAIFNGNIRPISSGVVMAAEAAIVVAALAVALRRIEHRTQPWLIMIALAGGFAALRMVAVGGFDVKPFRDMLLIATFAMLGLTTSRHRMVQAVIVLQIAVVAGIVLEATCLSCYSDLFQVKDYYVNTRGLALDEFTNEASDLYISATRPDERFFPFFDLHRLSSIFLEPVSLGNFAVIMVAFTTAMWGSLAHRVRLFMAVSILLTLVACDGRLSSAASLVILALMLLGRLVPVHSALLYVPLAALAALAVTQFLDLQSGLDDLRGRIAYSAELMADMDLADFLGISNRLLAKSADTGLVYLVVTQSLPGLALLLIHLVTAADEASLAQRRYKNGLFIFLSLTMMVSWSFLSIKTAAPMWFIYGALLRPTHAVAAGGESDGEAAPA